MLISLRELAEWTIAKEAELEALGPIGGDEMTIRRQQVSSSFKYILKNVFLTNSFLFAATFSRLGFCTSLPTSTGGETSDN